MPGERLTYCLPQSKVDEYLEKYGRITRGQILGYLPIDDHLTNGMQATLREVLTDLGLERRLKRIEDTVIIEAKKSLAMELASRKRGTEVLIRNRIGTK